MYVYMYSVYRVDYGGAAAPNTKRIVSDKHKDLLVVPAAYRTYKFPDIPSNNCPGYISISDM